MDLIQLNRLAWLIYRATRWSSHWINCFSVIGSTVQCVLVEQTNWHGIKMHFLYILLHNKLSSTHSHRRRNATWNGIIINCKCTKCHSIIIMEIKPVCLFFSRFLSLPLSVRSFRFSQTHFNAIAIDISINFQLKTVLITHKALSKERAAKCFRVFQEMICGGKRVFIKLVLWSNMCAHVCVGIASAKI